MKTKPFHTSRIIRIFFFIILLASCSNNQEAAVNSLKKGKYASIEHSGLESTFNRFVNNTRYSIGDTLTILDSLHFGYTNCGLYGFGKYKIEDDSLYLNFDSSATHMDSIMQLDKYSDTFYIQNDNILLKEFKVKLSKEGEAKYKAVTELHYIKSKVSNE